MTWAEICEDPVLRDLPYNIESNRWGRSVMSPPPDFWHGNYQTEIALLLKRLMPTGHVVSECPIETSDGVKGADVVWLCEEGRMQFFTSQGPIAASKICPAFPNELKL